MPNSKIILTKTNRPNATPHPNDLDYGELAINYEDGLLFFKNNSNRISKIASSGSFSQLTRHLADRENPHEVTQAQIGLDRVDNSNDLEKPISTSTQAALDVKVNLSTLNSEYYNKSETDGRVTTKFGEIRIQVESPAPANPAGNLSYDRDSNTFIYTEATIPTAESLGVLESASVRIDPPVNVVGSGALKYLGDGVFTYDRATIGGLDGYAKSEIGLTLKTSGDSDGTLTYNDGFFTYDQPTIAGLTDGKITLIDGVLDVAGFATSEELNALDVKETQDVGNLQSQVDSNDVDIAALQKEVDSNDVDIAALQAKDTSLQSQIDSNDDEIAALQAKDTSLQSQIDSNDDEISAAQVRISNNTAAITAVTSGLSGNNSDLTVLSNRINNNDSDITNLQDQINSNDEDVAALQAKDTSLQDQITSNDEDVAALQAKDTSLQDQINSNNSDISTLETSVGSQISALQVKDTSLQDQIDSNDSDITNLKAKDVNLGAQITTLTTQLGTTQTHLNAAVARVDSNDTDITNLQQKDSAQDNVINNKVTNLGSVTGIQKLTQNAYDQLTPNASTVYIIVD